MTRTAVVFGGTGGLGGAVVERLKADGFDVHPIGYPDIDATDEDAVRAFFDGVGTPWAVVNLIGGYAPGTPLADLDIAGLREQLELNLVSAAIITKHALPRLAAGGGGRLVHTSSRVAVQNGANGFAYSVSKLGVVRLVEAAGAEALAHGVTVNCIMPSIIDTPANRASMPNADFDRWPKPEQLADVISFLVSDGAELISGTAIPVYGRG